MDDKLIGFLKSTYGLDPLVVPKGTYKGMKEDTCFSPEGFSSSATKIFPMIWSTK